MRKFYLGCLLVSLLVCLALTTSALAAYATLEYKDNGDQVLKMQKALNALGYDTNGLDSKFGPSTEKAVRQFQKDNGLKVDGKAGDQTLTLLYSKSGSASQAASESKLTYGDRGDAVLKLQKALNTLGYTTGGTDGKFGPTTLQAVKAFQQDHQLSVDGIAGSRTLALVYEKAANSGSSSDANGGSADEGGSGSSLRYGDKNDSVKALQQALVRLGYATGGVDGHYGAATLQAVKSFQKAKGLHADGIAGAKTLSALYSGSDNNDSGSGSADAAGDAENTYETLRPGSKGGDVRKMQTALKALDYSVSVDGSYGSATQNAVKSFQKQNGLTVDGIAGKATLTLLYSGKAAQYEASKDASSSGSGSSGISAPDKSQIQLLHWFKEVKPSIRAGQKVQVYDPASGLSWTLRLYSLGRHADSEPLTQADTNAMYKAFGNDFNWNQRPVYVKLPDGRWTLASQPSKPHLSGSIKDNGFDGHLCLHFLRDMEECSKNDPKYGVANQKTIRTAWKKLTGEDVE